MNDWSGTITAGGTAQQLIGPRAGRRGYLMQNLSSGDLYISDAGTAAAAQPSFKVVAGALFETPPGYVYDGPVSVFGATTSQAFSARDY